MTVVDEGFDYNIHIRLHVQLTHKRVQLVIPSDGPSTNFQYDHHISHSNCGVPRVFLLALNVFSILL